MLNTPDSEVINISEVEAEPLQKWPNTPTLKDFKADLTEAQSDHDSHVADVEGWLDNLYVTGSAKIAAKKGRSKVQPRLIRKQAEWRYSALSEPFLSTPDLFNVSPISSEDRDAAFQNELVLNNQFNTKLNKIALVGEFVRTAVNEGTVICKVGWLSETQVVKVKKPIYEYRIEETEAVALKLQDLALVQASTDPMVFEQTIPFQDRRALELSLAQQKPIVAYHVDDEWVEEEMSVRNHPTVEVCEYDAVIVDPTCKGDLESAGFIIHKFETSLSQLKKAGIYKNLDRINLESNSILGASDTTKFNTTSFNFKDKARMKILAYEYWGYWDKEGDGIAVPIVATWVGDTLIRLDDNPYPDQTLPFVSAPLLPVAKSVYGEPDGALLEDNQKIIGAVTRGMIDLMGRSANGQIGARKDALDLPNRRKFIEGDDYEFNPNINPEQAFHMHKYPEIPQSALAMVQMQSNEAEALTGVKAFSSGISGQAYGNTATGVRSALDATSKRDLDILRRLADGFIKIGRKIIAMNSMFLDDEEVVRITSEKFVPIRRDDLAGNFDLKLTISTAEEDNQKAEELAFMLQTIGNNFDFGMVQMILSDIARLRKMPDLSKRISEYKVQPDPLQQMKAELEIKLLEAQLAEVQAKTQKIMSETGLNGVKAGTEAQKANLMSSEADKNQLDFIEQESGVTQSRELQKQSEQAKSQLETKVVSSAFDALVKQNEAKQAS